MNKYWITLPDYSIPLSQNIGSDFLLGTGINISMPNDPVRAPLIAFDLPSSSIANSQVTDGDIQNSVSALQEFQSEYDEALFIKFNLDASFGFNSFSACLDFVKQKKQTSKSVYSLITNSGEGESINMTEFVWKKTPASEQIEIEKERLKQFLADYGSHYISSLIYGFKIAISGTINTLDTAEYLTFKASFNSAFVNVSGSLKEEQKSFLRTCNLDAVITSGTITPARPWILKGFDDIYSFLEGLQTGKITINKAPVHCSLKSYWHTLIAYPKTRFVLQEEDTPQIDALFGVPSGTIIPWYPYKDEITTIATGTDHKKIINIPDGWALCDGSNHTPNLIGRTIFGINPTSDLDLLNTTSGQANFLYNGTTDDPRHANPDGWHVDGDNRNNPPQSTGLDHRHDFSLKVIPPHVKLLYLMKL